MSSLSLFSGVIREWENSPTAPLSFLEREFGAADACPKKETLRLAVPRRGHVLSKVAEKYGGPLREAVVVLSASLSRKQCGKIRASLFCNSDSFSSPDNARSDADMAAWAIVSMWVVAVAVRAIPVSASLVEAEELFFGRLISDRLTALLSDQAVRKAEIVLRAEADESAYLELLPYILDPHGPGSRLSVRDDPDTQAARSRKRKEGVFYTPADIAEYMAATCLDTLGSEIRPTIFDPACGTGVFLRAGLEELRRRHPEKGTFTLAHECLFGSDIDNWALDASAFVLLADCWSNLVGQGAIPGEAWRQLRLNLACTDTLLIDPSNGLAQQAAVNRHSLEELFPALEGAPKIILGNPPYADLGERSDIKELTRIFETIAVKPEKSAEVYLPFIEQMIRLADKETCSGALVLPLSVACNIGTQFSVTRTLISETRGSWRFAFFDREPHALFGEDVKTRNAIILWSRHPSDRRTVLATGPLRKWRGDSRATMFRTLGFTRFGGDIRSGIPKIEGTRQAAALEKLSTRWGHLEQVAQSIERTDLAKTPEADGKMVFVGPTAYNFLNVFFKPDKSLLRAGYTLSENPLHVVRCASRKDALAVFAILSSHLAYWWWHTHGDGFHVSRRFLTDLPFGGEDLSEETTTLLSKHGAELWSLIKDKPIMSLNRGRTSLAHTPNGHDEIRRKIDQVLAEIAGLEGAFVDELQQFTARTVAATLNLHMVTETEEKEQA